ncbi:MAG TPA: dihydrodipicolinate synthase family protein [Candidatus Hydrogenedentes bacterium]|nr:dihydrodipicolinate synthase family protein [Candidatus Hydrogenedentota bacterium]HOL75684.1 dihydrodipicolinate synthase family protein [Candidatus Hydrogenedentota bacterium]HPO84323.1 dihydrodipicolinate synthase family protein [Candidatus Hydrogenedentota bacterium]
MKQAVFFRGMMPIMPTAITKTGEIDEESQRNLVRYCIACGAVAIGHFGFASEFHKLTESQRSRLTEIIVDEVNHRVPVFIGITAPSVYGSIENARKAEAQGADLIMAMLPYMEVPDAEGAFKFYEDLSSAVSLPIIIQDAGHSSAVLTPPLLLKMFQEIEHILYVKSEGKDFLAKTHVLIQEAGSRLQVIGGAAGKHLIHMLRLGVTAFMTGTEALDIHASVVSSFLTGNEAEAFRIYCNRILPYLTFYMDYSTELLKEMLFRRGILSCSEAISPAPRPFMSEVERREFEWVLQQIDFPC